jgi:hypothetical protein
MKPSNSKKSYVLRVVGIGLIYMAAYIYSKPAVFSIEMINQILLITSGLLFFKLADWE